MLFLIGMRINKPWRPDLLATGFLRDARNKANRRETWDLGFLVLWLIFDPRGPWLVHDWDSVEQMYAYASSQNGRAPCGMDTQFNQRALEVPGAVGIWNETFQVARAESVYVGMPPSGLGAATKPGSRSASAYSDRAAQRIVAA